MEYGSDLHRPYLMCFFSRNSLSQGSSTSFASSRQCTSTWMGDILRNSLAVIDRRNLRNGRRDLVWKVNFVPSRTMHVHFSDCRTTRRSNLNPKSAVQRDAFCREQAFLGRRRHERVRTSFFSKHEVHFQRQASNGCMVSRRIYRGLRIPGFRMIFRRSCETTPPPLRVAW